MGAQRAPGALRLEAEARALYAVLSDGHDGLGFHVSRGCALRLAGTGQPVLSSEVPRGSWRPARDLHENGDHVDRRFNPYVLRHHLAGNYDVAVESPSWTSLVTFDIDRHLPGHAVDEDLVDFRLVAEANRQRDSVLAALSRAFEFGPSRLPVIQKTPSGGYHVTLGIDRGASGAGQGGEPERTWPAEWLREHICERLWSAGLELRPGVLELFPAGTRLRAPCGRGMLLLRPRHPDRPDELGLEPVAGTFQARADRERGVYRPVRQVAPMVRAFVAQLEEHRRPLEAWLGGDAPLWHPVRGPFRSRKKRESFSGTHALSRHKEEVQAAAPADLRADPDGEDGWLLRGGAYRDLIRSLLQFGLTQTGTRHDSVLKLIWFWAVVGGAPRDEVEHRLRAWLAEHDHASNLRERSVRAFVVQSVAEGMHYYDTRVMPLLAGTAPVLGIEVAPVPLGDAERVVLAEVASEVREEGAAILRGLRASVDAAGWVPGAVLLSGAVLERLCGERRVVVEVDGARQRRRASVVAREELERLGVLALHHDYSTGRHGRRYTCWYRFGSGVMPGRCPETGVRVLARRELSEGVLELVAARGGEKFPHVRLRPRRAVPEGGGRRWWVRLYERRMYTPRTFLGGDASSLMRAPRRWSPPVVPRQVGAAVAAVAELPRVAQPDPDPPVQLTALERAMAAALDAWSVANDERGPPRGA